MHKTYKIKVINSGNPDDGYKTKTRKAVVLHHPLADEVTLMGIQHKKKHYYEIVELLSGRTVVAAPSLLTALAELIMKNHSLKDYRKAIAKQIKDGGPVNEPLKSEVKE